MDSKSRRISIVEQNLKLSKDYIVGFTLIGFVTGFLLAYFYTNVGSETLFESMVLWISSSIFISTILIPIHEGIHYMFFCFFGKKPEIRLTIKPLKLYTYSHDKLALSKFMVILIGPFALISLGIITLSLFYPLISMGLMIGHITLCLSDFVLFMRLQKFFDSSTMISFDQESEELIIEIDA